MDPINSLFFEMRARILSLAADFDRLERDGWPMKATQVNQLREAMRVADGEETSRAARVQMVFSDVTPVER